MPASNKLVIRGGFFSLAGDDLSAYIDQIEIQLSRADVDLSDMSSLADRHGKGAGSHQFTVQLKHAVDDNTITKFRTAFNSNDPSAVVVRLRPASEAASASPTNLEYQFDVVVNSMPLGGSRNSAHMHSYNWPIDGQVTITDGTTPVAV